MFAAMKKNLTVAMGLGLLALAAGTATAGGSKGSLGVGGEAQINGLLGGVSANYDMGEFHLGGFLYVADPAGDDNTDIGLGARFFYHVHSTAMADFGVGGSVGLFFQGAPGDDDPMSVFIEPGFQIRAFVASNVALSFTGGLAIGAADAEGLLLSAQPTGTAGVHYYFF